MNLQFLGHSAVERSFQNAFILIDPFITNNPLNMGGQAKFSFAKLNFTPAWHSSSFLYGSYSGMLIEAENKHLYHAGATTLFSDMSLTGKMDTDVAFLPIDDTFTMSPEDALEAVKLIRSKTLIPILDTFGFQDAKAFQKAVETKTASHCVVLSPAEVFRLN